MLQASEMCHRLETLSCLYIAPELESEMLPISQALSMRPHPFTEGIFQLRQQRHVWAKKHLAISSL